MNQVIRQSFRIAESQPVCLSMGCSGWDRRRGADAVRVRQMQGCEMADESSGVRVSSGRDP